MSRARNIARFYALANVLALIFFQLSFSLSTSSVPRIQRGNSSNSKPQRAGGPGEPTHLPAWLSYPPIAASLQTFNSLRLRPKSPPTANGSLTAADRLAGNNCPQQRDNSGVKFSALSYFQTSLRSLFQTKFVELGRALCAAAVTFAASHWIKMSTASSDEKRQRFMSLPSVVSWFQPKCLVQVCGF
jgi:hypothetical protein